MIYLRNVSSDLLKRYDDERLSYVDGLNKGNILLLQNPTNWSVARVASIRDMSLSFLKQKLTPDQGNDIVFSFCRNIGNGQAYKLINAVNRYTEQVERQALLTKRRNANLFEYQKDDKVRIVKNNYAEIISYLIYTADELVWGELTDKQKQLYLSSIINNNQLDNIIKSKMIEYVSNYTTLEELEEINRKKYKSLNRFIVR